MCRAKDEGGRRCPERHRPGHNAMRRARRTLDRVHDSGVTAVLAAADPRPHYWWDKGTGTTCAHSKIKPLRDPTSPRWIPAGGLWTAPALPEELPPDQAPSSGVHTEWTDFVAVEQLHEPGAPGRGYLTEITPARDAVAVRISTKEELDAVCRRWPRSITTTIGEQIDGFSFQAMQRDGVHVVDVVAGPETTGHGALLHGFDVATRLWLTPNKHCTGERTPLRW